MFIVMLIYKKPLSEVDAFIPQHREFLDRYYAQGIFICSGRRASRTGGIIVAHNKTQAELELILKEDPFQTEGLADYEIFEFTPTKWCSEISSLIQAT